MARAWRALALLLALSTLPAWGPAGAQSILPEQSPYRDQLVLVSVTVLTPPQEVGLNGQVIYELEIEDLSADQAQQRGLFHTIILTTEVNRTGGNGEGWNAFLGQSFFSPTYGGDRFRTTATVQVTPIVKGQFFKFDVVARLESTTGQVVRDRVEVATRLTPFSLASVDLQYAPAVVGPEEEATIGVALANGGQYPDTFLLSVAAPEGWFTSVQPRVSLFPGESRVVQVSILTPATRVFVPQETGVILVRVQSVLDPSVVYERAAVVTLEGFYFPGYWVPLLALGAVLAAGLGTKAVEAGRRRAKEQGKPGRPRVTPAQAVLLEDLKHRDPERYRAIVAAQRRAFRTKVRAFGHLRERRAGLERALVLQQHANARVAKNEERARQRAEESREAELQRRRESLEAERQRRERAVLAKRRAEERRRLAEERRIAQLEAPRRRREERERRMAERRLKAQIAAQRRRRAVEDRKERIEKERRARILARKKQELERRAARAARRSKGKGRGGPPEGAP